MIIVLKPNSTSEQIDHILERIQELLGGANLEDPEMRLNVQLALKIRAALGGSAP